MASIVLGIVNRSGYVHTSSDIISSPPEELDSSMLMGR